MVRAPARWCRDGLSRDCVGNHSGCCLLALGIISYFTFAWRDTQNVKAYGVTENEIDELGTLNTQTTIFFSLATGLCSFGGGLYVNWIMAGMPSPHG